VINITTTKKVDLYLGMQIRKKREHKKISLTQAAKEMDISPSLLSQIERGIVSPSISTLRRIADYLGTYIGVLLGERISKENAIIVRKGNENRSIIWGKGVKLHILSPGNSNLEFMYDEYEVNSSTGDKLYRHEGKGDFIWFLSTIPHQITNLSNKKSLAIWVDSPPRF